jgi:hypothetical protein
VKVHGHGYLSAGGPSSIPLLARLHCQINCWRFSLVFGVLGVLLSFNIAPS